MSNSSFDGVFKMGGVCATAGTTEDKTKCWIRVAEINDGIKLTIPGYHTPVMTVAEARSLAAQIMEQARRHEVRKTAK